MYGFEAELSLRPFNPKDCTECHELFSAGMLPLIPPITKIVFYKYVPYAVLSLPVVAAIRWSLLDVLLYLGLCTLLVAIVYIQVYLEVTNYIKVRLNTDLQDIANYYKDGSCMFVAELDGKVVGMCAVVKKEHHKPGEAELQSMSVSSAIRKRGIGKKLVKMVEEFCKKHQYNKLILTTTNAQIAAMALYSKCGFEVIERKPVSTFLQNLKYVIFEKDIPSEH